MTNRKNTSRALVASALAVLLCVSMLVGSTFAWFTDNATTNVNTIQAGTLEIKLTGLDGRDLENGTVQFIRNNALINDSILWEPGCRYILEPIKLENIGNLNLKFKVVVTGLNGTPTNGSAAVDLAEVIEVINPNATPATTSTLRAAMDDADGIAYGELAPKGAANSYVELSGIELHMLETAGNEYQGQSLESIQITVMAIQNTVETDSYTNEYDKNAEFDKVVVVKDQTALNDAITNAQPNENGQTVIKLPATEEDEELTLPNLSNKDVVFSGNTANPADTVIDTTNGMPGSNGADLTFEGVTVNFKEGGQYGTNGFTHSEKVVYKNSVINGTQFLYSDAEFINCKFNVSGDAYAVWTYGAKNVTFTGCTFNTSGKAILVYTESATTATINVKDCTFNTTTGNGLGKAAVEVGESAYGNLANYTINLNNCTTDSGFTTTAESNTTFGGTNLGTALWGNKNLMPADRLNIFVDGKDVY